TPGTGRVLMTGLVEEEELGGGGKTLRRKSMARASVDNVLTVLRRYLGIEALDYDIHLNFPGGTPIDGPSAGISILTAIYSAVRNLPVDNRVAMTGEVSLRGLVRPVGGIVAKVEAARQAGAEKVLIPQDNYQQLLAEIKDIEVIPVKHISEVIRHAILVREEKSQGQTLAAMSL
ncbi:S16 family serine protease, partial [Carboxydocella sp. JDF658]